MSAPSVVTSASVTSLTATVRGSVIEDTGTCLASDMMTTIIIIAVAVVVLFLPVAALRIVLGWRRKMRHQAKLDEAFERARQVRQSGSGIQGMPYSHYTDP